MTNILITAEHASNRLPAESHGLGLAPETLETHVAWDPGALELARTAHSIIGGDLLVGEWSRLWVDLNRSDTNPRIAPARSFGVEVPGNVGLSREALQRRIEAWWRPFRDRARRIVEAGDRCIHVGMHTFTPDIGGGSRDFDLAILYDPRRQWEKELAAEIVSFWRAQGWKVRRNAPYRGVSDGHTTALRRLFPNERYAGLEIEANQRSLGDWDRVRTAVVEGIKQALEKQKTRL